MTSELTPMPTEQIQAVIKREQQRVAQAVVSSTTAKLLATWAAMEEHRGHGCTKDNKKERNLVVKQLKQRGIIVRAKTEKYQKYVREHNANSSI